MVLTAEIDAEIVAFAFARSSYVHGEWSVGYLQKYVLVRRVVIVEVRFGRGVY